jgi:hypothetical protein
MQKHLVKKAEIEPKTRTRSSSAPKMGEEGLMRILFMLIVYRGLPRDECDEILTSRRFFHTGFYTAHAAWWCRAGACRRCSLQQKWARAARRLALCAWTVFFTNVPADRLTVAELLTLARARWQIELLIKLWKSHGKIDESRSQKPYRVLCDIYAKLLAMVVQHWLFLVNLWAFPDRSLVKAARTVKRRAMELASSFGKRHRLIAAIRDIGQCITGCRMNRRKQEPNTYQLLQDASLLGIGMREESA